ncbi:hypothetical protein IMAU30106_01480 [Lactiplantibacillus plantarum]|nr:hypothetical protein [Lactiplantibacillus plantarum]MCG0815673.1 hypothetical protein [Lactiplantibacillus plantarum]MCG0818380.1 hypothetical protein [Lactiplantibacillus plantarum]MCG0840674.1 hypothetical protein [Lactiplantibacillus plantarum]MCG0937832.1 hypothetical protein [Lactiplantibacillus plantarum]
MTFLGVEIGSYADWASAILSFWQLLLYFGDNKVINVDSTLKQASKI